MVFLFFKQLPGYKVHNIIYVGIDRKKINSVFTSTTIIITYNYCQQYGLIMMFDLLHKYINTYSRYKPIPNIYLL